MILYKPYKSRIIENNETELEKDSEIKIDGGVTRNEYLCQFQANLLGSSLLKSSATDGTIQGVFLGCLAFCNKEKFKEHFNRKMEGKRIEPTNDSEILKTLQTKFTKFDKIIREIIESKSK